MCDTNTAECTPTSGKSKLNYKTTQALQMLMDNKFRAASINYLQFI